MKKQDHAWNQDLSADVSPVHILFVQYDTHRDTTFKFPMISSDENEFSFRSTMNFSIL